MKNAVQEGKWTKIAAIATVIGTSLAVATFVTRRLESGNQRSLNASNENDSSPITQRSSPESLSNVSSDSRHRTKDNPSLAETSWEFRLLDIKEFPDIFFCV